MLGCFQIESPGQQDLIARLQPRHMQDVIADISLFRPGPVAGGMPARFIAARYGTELPRYPHPDLEPILDDTYGVVIWHEQIIAIFSELPGRTLRLADPEALAKGRITMDVERGPVLLCDQRRVIGGRLEAVNAGAEAKGSGLAQENDRRVQRR